MAIDQKLSEEEAIPIAYFEMKEHWFLKMCQVFHQDPADADLDGEDWTRPTDEFKAGWKAALEWRDGN